MTGHARICPVCDGTGGEEDCNDCWVKCDACNGLGTRPDRRVEASTAGHAHRCSLCGKSKMCTAPGCDRLPGEPNRCDSCTGALDAVDALPNPKRAELGIATLVRIVARGTRAALAMRSQDPERCPDVLEQYVAGMLPVDPTRTDADTWARLGAVQGARDAWAGAQWRPPPDCPPGEAVAAYVIGWQASASMVMKIRMEVDNGR